MARYSAIPSAHSELLIQAPSVPVNTSKNSPGAPLDIRYAVYSVQINTIFKIPNKVYKVIIKSCKKGGNSLKYIFKAVFILLY